MSYKPLFVLSVCFCCFACSPDKRKEQTEERQEAKTAVQNDLPSMDVMLVDSTKQTIKKLKGKIVLVLFQPDCDHCQREAQDIERNITAFKDYSVYFISSDPIHQVKKFSVDYKLNDKSNFFFGATSTESILNNFGPVSAPSLYIYDNGKLVESFNGEVAIEVVVKYL